MYNTNNNKAGVLGSFQMRMQYSTDVSQVCTSKHLKIDNSFGKKVYIAYEVQNSEDVPGYLRDDSNNSKGKITCSICFLVFTHKRSLYDHNRGVHAIGTPFKCSCGALFLSRRTLNRHKQRCKYSDLYGVQICS